MGKSLKRVPMDFKYPLNQTWKGYINPYKSIECKACNGSGFNEATMKLNKEWYTYSDNGKIIEGWQYNLEQDEVQALLNANRLWDFTRVAINNEQKEIIKQKIKEGGNSWLPFNNGYIPTANEVNVWAKIGFGHDTTNRIICVKTRAMRLGVFGICSYCDGEGEAWYSDEIRKLYDECKQYDPPIGDGYQLWELEQPISSVFLTLDDLCEWAADNVYVFEFNKLKNSKEKWKQVLTAYYCVQYEDGTIKFK